MWKNNSPVTIVSYCPKPNKNVLLASTAYSEPDLCEALHQKPVIVEFYKRCGVDILNQMLCDYACHSARDS